MKLKNARLTYQPKKKYGGAENKQPVKYAFPGITVVNVDHKLIANPEACEKKHTKYFAENDRRQDQPYYHFNYTCSDIQFSERKKPGGLHINNPARNRVII